MRTGTRVTPRNEAKNIENVFVNASGRNSRPSCAVSENTGMKLTVITRRAKNSGRPTLLAAATMTFTRSDPVGSRPCSSRKCSSALCAFSIMMIAESTIAPMAMAIPPNDMMLEVTFIHHIGINDRMMAIGSVMIATNDERTCQRKTTQTSATTMLSSISFSRSVAIARLIKSLRSYVGVAHLDRADDIAEWDVVGDERVWIEIDLVLLHKAADGRDFRDAFH